MPIYTWADHKNEKTVDVIRTFDNYKDEPTQEECDWDISEAKWERVISANIGVKKAWRWGGGKGNWMLVFAIVAASLLLPGCVTPKQWTQNQHQDQMLMCKKMCEGVGVAKYETFTGDCMCYQQSPMHTSILR